MASPLTLPTADGSGTAIHPSVERVPGGLGGFQYWMGNTPWPDTQSHLENPHVYCSTDGLTWQVPPGVTNPLDRAGEGGGYNSDPELVWDGTVLHYLWRRTGTAMEGILHRSTTDGRNFTPTAQIWAGDPSQWMSPCIWWDGTNFHLWTVSQNHRGVGEVWDVDRGRWRHVILYRTASTIPGLGSASWTPVPSSFFHGILTSNDPWHIGVTRHDGVWHMLIGVGELGWGGGGSTFALAASSDGVNWRVADRAIMRTIPGSWQDSRMYRPSLRVETGRVRVWYSVNGSMDAQTGYCEFPPAYLLTPPD